MNKNEKCCGIEPPTRDTVCIPRGCRAVESAYGQLPNLSPSKDHAQRLPWVYANFSLY